MRHRLFDQKTDRRRTAWAGKPAGRASAGTRSTSRRPREDDGIPMRWVWAVLAVIATAMVAWSNGYRADDALALLSPPATRTTGPSTIVGLAPAMPGSAFAARPMPVCGGGRRGNCVVDGDTFWIDGEKVRVETIDAPEVEGRCASERALAARATHRLSQLLSNRSIELARNGTDRYGRTLARVRTQSGEVGAILVGEGLAQRWAGRRAEWCSA